MACIPYWSTQLHSYRHTVPGLLWRDLEGTKKKLTCSLALCAAEGLMDHDARVRQRVPFALRAHTAGWGLELRVGFRV